MALSLGTNGAYIHELTQLVSNNTQFRISVIIRVTSYGTGPSEILALANGAGTFQLVTAAGVRGCGVHMDSAGALTIVSNNTSAVQTTPAGITLALNTTYYVALNYSGASGVYSLAVRNINTVGAATTVTAHTQNLLGFVFRLNTKTGESGVTQIEALNCEPAIAEKNHNIQWIIPEAHATGRPPADRQRYGYMPAHRGYYNNALLALGDSVDEANARFYQNNTNYALVGLVRAKLRAAKHHRRIRRTVGNWAYSSGGTQSGAPPASITATRSVSSTANTTTEAPAVVLDVSRAVASTGNTTTTASAAVAVQRDVASTGNTTTTATAAVGASAAVTSTGNTTTTAPAVTLSTARPVTSTGNTTTTATATVGASAAVASTANTITTGTAQAGNGVVSQAVTSTGAPAAVLAVTYPVASTANTSTEAFSRLVAPVASTGNTTTTASAAISTSRVVASTGNTTTAAAAAIGASAAVTSTANTTTTAAAAVGRFQDVVSTSSTLSGATAAALSAARSITSTADTFTGAPGAGVGVVVISPIATNYVGASNTFCRAPDAKITVGFAPTSQRRKREWPYHPR